VLGAFDRPSLDLSPVDTCVHLFIHQTTHQHKISTNDEHAHFVDFAFLFAAYGLDGALFAGCEYEVRLVVNGGEYALVGSTVDGDDSDNI